MSRHPAKPPSQRQLRVGEELRHVISEVLSQGHFRDPDLRDANITVTEVRVSPDLKNATVFITPLGGTDMGETVRALRRASGFIRREMARELTLRVTPELAFEPDTSFETAERIEDILHHPRVRRDVESSVADEESDEPEA